jgi:hypothetical protein
MSCYCCGARTVYDPWHDHFPEQFGLFDVSEVFVPLAALDDAGDDEVGRTKTVHAPKSCNARRPTA